jgi:hypothetical protein
MKVRESTPPARMLCRPAQKSACQLISKKKTGHPPNKQTGRVYDRMFQFFRISGLGSRALFLGFWTSGSGFRVSGFRCQVSSLGFHVSGFRFRVRVPGFGFKVSGFGFRVLGLGFLREGLELEVHRQGACRRQGAPSLTALPT